MIGDKHFRHADFVGDGTKAALCLVTDPIENSALAGIETQTKLPTLPVNLTAVTVKLWPLGRAISIGFKRGDASAPLGETRQPRHHVAVLGGLHSCRQFQQFRRVMLYKMAKPSIGRPNKCVEGRMPSPPVGAILTQSKRTIRSRRTLSKAKRNGAWQTQAVASATPRLANAAVAVFAQLHDQRRQLAIARQHGLAASNGCRFSGGSGQQIVAINGFPSCKNNFGIALRTRARRHATLVVCLAALN